MFIGRTNIEAETPILWSPDEKNWLIGKYQWAGKDWRQEEKGMTEDEMVGWHHQLNGREFEKALGVSDRQGSLACCSPWGYKELDMTEWLNWTEKIALRVSRVSIKMWKIFLDKQRNFLSDLSASKMRLHLKNTSNGPVSLIPPLAYSHNILESIWVLDLH